MGEARDQYNKDFAPGDWDAFMRSYTVARLAFPHHDRHSLDLSIESADDLIRILKHRDRVRVVEIEVERGPRFLDAVFWGFGLWAFFDFAAAFVRGLLS